MGWRIFLFILVIVFRTFSIIVLSLVVAQIANAQTVRPRTDNYIMNSDVQPAGGGDEAVSSNYVLDDTIGEGNIGPSRSDNYSLGAGYRQTVNDAFVSLECDDGLNLGVLAITGRQTGNVLCTVETDAEAGYSMDWTVRTGSGGTSTGYLINELEETIPPFEPAIEGVPETWFVADSDARWAGRLSSTSTDTDAKWGIDNSTDKWLNVGTGSYSIVTRSSRTDPGGSAQVLQFRAEIGAAAIQMPGTYRATVVITATAL